MSNLHRIRWFDGQIREGRYPNSAALAGRFEISRRQAQRDVEYLAYSLSAPLLYVAKYRGYCCEDKTYALPLLYMTDEEQKILNDLARRYRQYDYDGAASVKRIADLLKRDLEAYAARLALVWPACEPIAACYAVVASAFACLADGVRPGEEPRAIALLRKAAEAEDEAIRRMKGLMSERLRNRFDDIALR